MVCYRSQLLPRASKYDKQESGQDPYHAGIVLAIVNGHISALAGVIAIGE